MIDIESPFLVLLICFALIWSKLALECIITTAIAIADSKSKSKRSRGRLHAPGPVVALSLLKFSLFRAAFVFQFLYFGNTSAKHRQRLNLARHHKTIEAHRHVGTGWLCQFSLTGFFSFNFCRQVKNQEFKINFC